MNFIFMVHWVWIGLENYLYHRYFIWEQKVRISQSKEKFWWDYNETHETLKYFHIFCKLNTKNLKTVKDIITENITAISICFQPWYLRLVKMGVAFHVVYCSSIINEIFFFFLNQCLFIGSFFWCFAANMRERFSQLCLDGSGFKIYRVSQKKLPLRFCGTLLFSWYLKPLFTYRKVFVCKMNIIDIPLFWI